MKWFKITYFAVAIVLLISCKKESENINLTAIDLHEEGKIHQIKFLNEQIGFACGGSLWTNGFIYKTTDGGNTWTEILESPNIVFGLDFTSEDTITAGGFSGWLWQTVDGGNYWKYSEIGPDYLPLTAITYTTPDRVLFSMGFKYFIGGKGWFNTQTGEHSGYDELIAMEDVYAFNENEAIFCGYGNIFKTYDNASSYQPKEIPNAYYKAIDFEGDKGLCVSYNGLVMYSANKGEAWDKMTKKGSTMSFKNKFEDVAIKNNTAIICGHDGTIYKMLLTDKNLIQLKHNFDNVDFYSAYLNNNTAFLGSEGIIYKFSY